MLGFYVGVTEKVMVRNRREKRRIEQQKKGRKRREERDKVKRR